jgi:hypothetical protein
MSSCRHCHLGRVSRPRGLCWHCYYTAGVRDHYPPTSKYSRRGVGNFCGDTPLPPLPTDAPPGSRAKVEVLMERAARHQTLWHPDDATAAGPVRRELAQVG